MWELRSRPPHMLSAGQKQRVAIAGALAVQPKVLVLDEATAMLDPAGRAAVIELLRALHARGTTILTITHEMEEAALAQRIIVLDQGRVVMDQTPREVFARAAELHDLGLGVPRIASLARQLGLPVCLSVDELLHALGTPPEGSSTSDVEPREYQEHNAPLKPPAILVQNLSHTYLRGTPFATLALREANLDVLPGEVMGLIGQTGSGKSTLMQHLNGLMRPQSGHVIVHDRDWSDPSIDVAAARREVGLLFQQPEDQLFERYIGDDVAFGPRQQGLEPLVVRERVKNAMALVGLDFESFKDRRPEELSGGEQRRVALAGVLALQPQILVVDEPTAGLDPRGRETILDILRRLHHEGLTLVMASHRMDDIAALCQRAAALRDGQVIVSGPVREILGSTSPRVQALHLPLAPAAELATNLRAGGWPIPASVFTLEEIAAAVTACAPTRFEKARQA
jgi:energy-coupling factor transport system ATP-binding protein